MLVIPHIIDQFIWGNKVAQLGVGPKSIPRPKLKVEDLAVALRQMQSPEMRQKAAALGAAIRAEPDGVAEAVRLILFGDTYPAACGGTRGSGLAPRFIPLIEELIGRKESTS
jgi:hypothetical protein